MNSTVVRNPVLDFSTKTSKNGKESFSSFSKVNWRAGCRLLRCFRNISHLASVLKMVYVYPELNVLPLAIFVQITHS